ncbi:MAG: argininosuccinate lyase [Acidobacteria bacterium]|nr:argininosuccinate lyase [Acidobacteriota bacterium]
MWGSRFATAADARLRAFNDSFRFDWRLLEQDIAGSIAWAEALGKAGVLSQREERRVVRALRELLDETSGKTLPLDAHEDVHSFVESALSQKVGALAKKLHTGRSRNDQVATDLRLWLADAALEAVSLLAPLAATLVALAKREAATPMPGYTHLKQAEPVTFGHWCLAYVEMLFRDADRLLSAYGRGDECPLGSGALAGSPVEIDREALASALGFARPSANSLDAVSDRDFAADYLYASTLLLGHLSRLAEDLIFFSSDEAAYVELPDAMATGSSRMPQKKNPDVLELVRGHAGRAIGETTGFLALLKGLPLAYDKDLQLDKEPLFRMRETLAAALPALEALVAGLTLNRDRMLAAASSDLLLATAVADALAARGIAFREAHEIVGRRIAEAIAKKTTLKQLGPGGGITAADLHALDPARSVAAKKSIGGTSPKRVRSAAVAAAKRANALATLIAKESRR